MKSGTPTEFRAGHEETMRDTKREKNEAQPQLRPKGDHTVAGAKDRGHTTEGQGRGVVRVTPMLFFFLFRFVAHNKQRTKRNKKG